MRETSETGFTEFVRDRSTALLRTAVLLAGGDRGHAEDLLQGVLERMYVRWDRIEGPPEAYAGWYEAPARRRGGTAPTSAPRTPPGTRP